jgi:hypothetical protein
MTAVYIAVRGKQDPAEAWADSEGLYVCFVHRYEARRHLLPEYHLVRCSDYLADTVRAEGVCGQCYDEDVESLRRSCEADADARLEDYLHRHR